jgi:hypothetical protein
MIKVKQIVSTGLQQIGSLFVALVAVTAFFLVVLRVEARDLFLGLKKLVNKTIKNSSGN